MKRHHRIEDIVYFTALTDCFGTIHSRGTERFIELRICLPDMARRDYHWIRGEFGGRLMLGRAGEILAWSAVSGLAVEVLDIVRQYTHRLQIPIDRALGEYRWAVSTAQPERIVRR